MLSVEINISLDERTADTLQKCAVERQQSVAQYVAELICKDARQYEDELAAEGYRVLSDDTKVFAEAALPLTKECWPQELWPVGVPGETLLQFAGMIPLDELEQMERDIEEGCEQIDLSQW